MLTLEDSDGKYMVCFTLTAQRRLPQIEKCVVVGTDNIATASALGRVVTALKNVSIRTLGDLANLVDRVDKLNVCHGVERVKAVSYTRKCKVLSSEARCKPCHKGIKEQQVQMLQKQKRASQRQKKAGSDSVNFEHYKKLHETEENQQLKATAPGEADPVLVSVEQSLSAKKLEALSRKEDHQRKLATVIGQIELQEDVDGDALQRSDSRSAASTAVLYYLGGYVVKKAAKMTSCSDCHCTLEAASDAAPAAALTELRSFVPGALKHPSAAFNVHVVRHRVRHRAAH
ncbi:hypothetical protein MRX96_053552 [Rhipicephalus microplus]